MTEEWEIDDDDVLEPDEGDQDAIIVLPKRKSDDAYKGRTERVENDPATDLSAPLVGRWFWLTLKKKKKESWEFETAEHPEDHSRDKLARVLVCCTYVGSNYAEVRTTLTNSTYDGSNGSYWRIHFNDWYAETAPVPDPQKVLKGGVERHQHRVGQLLAEVQEITRRLGVGATPALAEASQSAQETQAIAVINREDPHAALNSYKAALVLAKTEKLPALFKEVEQENRMVARWMKMETLPLQAEVGRLDPIVKKIDDRIFNVGLYAGLSEDVKLIRDGEPAPKDTPIHLFQRRHYMDEECLVDYKVGGMEFKAIEDFDQWMLKKSNWSRILPYDRSVVAFQVRRHAKNRDDQYRKYINSGDIVGYIRLAMQSYAEDHANLWTFLYIRNGEKIYRLNTTIEFGRQEEDDSELASKHKVGSAGGGKLFPDMNVAAFARAGSVGLGKDGGTKLYFKRKFSTYDVVTEEGLQALREHDEEEARKKEEEIEVWEAREKARRQKDLEEAQAEVDRIKAGGDGFLKEAKDQLKRAKSRLNDWEYPFPRFLNQKADGYEPFTDDNVYYDDVCEQISEAMNEHNRLVLLLQGLLDRSEVFHPHPNWKLWEDGFTSGVRLVYDDSRALVDGEAPDFEAYAAKLRESIGVGSVVIGAQGAWRKREAARENARRQRSWRYKSTDKVSGWWEPYGDDGPGYLAKVVEIKGKGDKQRAVFRWTKERTWEQKRAWAKKEAWRVNRNVRYDEAPPIECSIEVPVKDLFNVSAYRIGDYRQFYNDPRTRADYIQWARFLLEAEEYLAGNREVGQKDGSVDDEEEDE